MALRNRPAGEPAPRRDRKIGEGQSEEVIAGGDTEYELNAARGGKLLSPESFSVYSHRILLAYCLTAALSIAAAQSLLAALIVYWLLLGGPRRLGQNRLSAPVLAWVAVNVISALAGIAPWRSFVETAKASLYLLVPFAVYASCSSVTLSRRQFLGRLESYVTALVLGQCLAAVHTICSEVVGSEIPLGIPGALTESGQLVLIIPLLLSAAFYAFATQEKSDLTFALFGREIPPQLYAALVFGCLLVVAWPGAILWEELAMGTLLFRMLALVAALALAAPVLRRGMPHLKGKFGGASLLPLDLFQLLWPASALLFAALLINLKRGPWFGVFVELIAIGFLLSRRLLFWSVLLSFFLLLTLSPARTRVANMNEHFSIGGGRKQMWELGAEIAQRYPLGLGSNNARYMRELDPSIPETHRHMHNNPLNVLVETGWMGLMTYLWWIFSALALSVTCWTRSRESKDRTVKQLGVFALCLGLALLGWQVSGFVEYNFGDGEIRLIAFLYMGLLLAIERFTRSSVSQVGTAA